MSGALRGAVMGRACGAAQCVAGEAADVAPATRNASQAAWAAMDVRNRLRVLRAARYRMADCSAEFADAISPRLARSKADTLVTELLPLLDACRFLEREAESILKPRRLGRAGRPMWLSGVWAEVHRDALGHVLVIGPANFPLFLAGTQVLQALAAGNSVTWKPGTGGVAVAQMVARVLREAGLPAGLLDVTGDSVSAGREAVAARPDKVIFTGSQAAGTAVLSELAKTATPAVVELSGADAIVVLPSADLEMVAKAVTFGLRLNGGAVCMSPRRLFALPATMAMLRPLLVKALEVVPAVKMDAKAAGMFQRMVDAAVADGASVTAELDAEQQRAVVIDHATAEMEIARSDVFAPVISLIEVPTLMHLHEAYARCEYALTVALFCAKDNVAKALEVGRTLKAGTVLINDVIAPTADPRVPFGGRGASGYGVTRGAEGLLEMTTVKTVIVRRRGKMRHFDATTDADAVLFAGMIQASHGDGWRARLDGLRKLMGALRGR